MKPRISLITLCVDDLEKSLKFYRDGLGLKTPGIVGTEFEYGAVVFFELEAGLKLALWPRKSLSKDSGLPVAPPSPTEFAIGHNVSSKAEVDAVMEQARMAGAFIVKPGHDTSGAATQVTSMIWISICGGSLGIPNRLFLNEDSFGYKLNKV